LNYHPGGVSFLLPLDKNIWGPTSIQRCPLMLETMAHHYDPIVSAKDVSPSSLQKEAGHDQDQGFRPQLEDLTA
jgi:hypothetical protein